MQLIVEGRGLFLHKHQGRLRLSQNQKVVKEVALLHLKEIIVVDSGVGISSDVIRTCSEEGIAIHFLSRRGTAIASLYSAGLTGTVLTRRAQLLAYEHEQGVTVAKTFVRGKLENQATLLRYLAKSRRESAPALHDALNQGAAEVRDALSELDGVQAAHICQLSRGGPLAARRPQGYAEIVAGLLVIRLEFDRLPEGSDRAGRVVSGFSRQAEVIPGFRVRRIGLHSFFKLGERAFLVA